MRSCWGAGRCCADQHAPRQPVSRHQLQGAAGGTIAVSVQGGPSGLSTLRRAIACAVPPTATTQNKGSARNGSIAVHMAACMSNASIGGGSGKSDRSTPGTPLRARSLFGTLTGQNGPGGASGGVRSQWSRQCLNGGTLSCLWSCGDLALSELATPFEELCSVLPPCRQVRKLACPTVSKALVCSVILIVPPVILRTGDRTSKLAEHRTLVHAQRKCQL